jgi:Activator of Hsp90 ATPase homolog 1-like protein
MSSSSSAPSRPTLEPDGDDGTHLTLVHTGLPLSALHDHREGWNNFLNRLTSRAAGGDPGPDTTAAGTPGVQPPGARGI